MTTATKERPIIFSGESVRAILDVRKTQTRRVINRVAGFGPVTEVQNATRPRSNLRFKDRRMWWHDLTRDDLLARCPYGVPGDRLWVREPLWRNGGYVATDSPPFDNCGKISSRYMPRRDSRILLEITNVRVERVQAISLEDCEAEGIDLEGEHATDFCAAEKAGTAGLSCGCRYPEIYPFACLWDRINARRGFGWDVNPFVWVIEFRIVEASERSGAT